jgi:hypothetical protein
MDQQEAEDPEKPVSARLLKKSEAFLAGTPLRLVDTEALGNSSPLMVLQTW